MPDAAARALGHAAADRRLRGGREDVEEAVEGRSGVAGVQGAMTR